MEKDADTKRLLKPLTVGRAQRVLVSGALPQKRTRWTESYITFYKARVNRIHPS